MNVDFSNTTLAALIQTGRFLFDTLRRRLGAPPATRDDAGAIHALVRRPDLLAKPSNLSTVCWVT
jgi:hypothetical protein